jgi:hypothetical protein
MLSLTLNGIKRRGGDQCAKFRLMQGKQVRIWSCEHLAWWRPDRAGYTVFKDAAGIYSFEDAYEATKYCGPEKRITYYEAKP